MIGIALRPLPLDIAPMSAGVQITIEVPLGYAQRDPLLAFIESKFPGAKISIVHSEVSNPTVSEALVERDLRLRPQKQQQTTQAKTLKAC